MGISEKTRKTSYILKAIVIVSAVVGTLISAGLGREGGFMRGKGVFMYFTIQSNLALALIAGLGYPRLSSGKEISKTWQVVKFTGTISILLTGFVFCFVLAPTLGSHAWTLPNILTHVIVPVCSIADFFMLAPLFDLKAKHVPFVLIPPAVYAVFAAIGYVAGWEFAPGVNYPYFFLNWGSPAGAFGFSSQLPFMGCAWWILALFFFLVLCGLLFLAIARRISRK